MKSYVQKGSKILRNSRYANSKPQAGSLFTGNYRDAVDLYGARVDINFAQNDYLGVLPSQMALTRNLAGAALNQNGSVVLFGPNQPRLTNQGLLVEETRTNLFLNSYTPVTQTVTVVSTSVYTVSLYGTGNAVLSGAGTGTVTQGSPVTITASTTSLTVTLSGTVQAVQVELGSSPTSIIPTGGTSVTRPTESVSFTGLGIRPNLLNLQSGTFYAEAIPGASNAGGGATRRFCQFNNSGSTNLIIVGQNNANAGRTMFQDTSVVQADIATGTINPGVINKLAFRFGLNDFMNAVNGTLGTPDTAGTMPAVLDQLWIGSSDGSQANTFLNGYVRRIAYFPQKLSDSDLKFLTT